MEIDNLPIEVSVVMPVYNCESFLREAIESILNQTYTKFEFIIVNDGSTDSSLEIIKSYNDTRIKLINQKNGGVSNALNTGINNACGKYIVRMDADDISHITRIERQYNFIRSNPEYILVGCDVNYITEEKEFIFRYHSPAYSNEDISKLITTYCTFIHTAVIFDRDIILKEGGYHQDAYAFEDHFLWSKIIHKNYGKVCNMEEVLVDVRLNAGSVTVDFNDYALEYLKTKNKVLISGIINEEDAVILRIGFKKLNSKLRKLSYHRLLAKKYLWNNYDIRKARKHLREALKIDLFNRKTINIFIVSIFPKKIIRFIYSFKKAL